MRKKAKRINIFMFAAIVMAIGTIAVVILTSETSNTPTTPGRGRSMSADVMNDPAYQERIEELRAIGMRDHEVRATLEVHGRHVNIDFIAGQWQRTQERRSDNPSYILNGTDFPVASNDIDMATIKRFVFSFADLHSGHSLVVDKMYGGVYFCNWSNLRYMSLSSMPFSATFTQQDLDRLILAIEESDLRHWQENYEGERGQDHQFFYWSLGIEFADGSLMRRSGSGSWDYSPPEHQWDIFTNFINTMGEEIMERHNAENPQADE